ncbi:protein of unknown function [Caballeronia sp. S22]
MMADSLNSIGLLANMVETLMALFFGYP